MTNKILCIGKNESHVNINFLGLKIKLRYKPAEKAVAFIDCGGIGDYILLRKYLKYLKLSPKFSGYKLVYFSKKIYKNMILCYDENIFDDIIIYNGSEAVNLSKNLKKYKFEYIVNLYAFGNCTNFNFTWKTRANLAKKINAKYKIADVIKSENFEKRKNLKYWNELIATEPVYFESERRRLFFEKLLEMHIPEENLYIEPKFDLKKDYIVVSLLSNVEERNYSKEKWVEIINYILRHSNKELQLLFIGVDKDRKEAKEILDCIDDPNHQCKNLIGFTDITMLPMILSGAEFLLACETGTVHIANAVRCKSICLSCGAYYGRFLPYENGFVEYVFPDKFQELIDKNNQAELKKYYDIGKKDIPCSVKDISSEKVIKVLNKYLIADKTETSVTVE